MKIFVPPIKSQGIKTKLVPWIKEVVPKNFSGRWLEPFMGTGVVAFNIAPSDAILGDVNPHLIAFYSALAAKNITPEAVKDFLEYEGSLLLEKGKEHYYEIRSRFNEKKDPLDFLFLNRSGFNGMIRFNRKGGLNVPFCHKPNRFARAYVTKIVNQVKYLYNLFQIKDFKFECTEFKNIISYAKEGDIIYCDPPYIGRHVDYFNGWDEEKEIELKNLLSETKAKFILSTWHSNDYRKNEYIDILW